MGHDLCRGRNGVPSAGPRRESRGVRERPRRGGGFLVGNADGPAEVPAYTAVGARTGLFANGGLGMLATTAPPPSQAHHRAGWLALFAGPSAALLLTMLLQKACPLYVGGRQAGFCDYQGVDLLGGWLSGVIVAFVVDAWFVAGLFAVSARQALRAEDATDPKWRRLAARAYSARG